jgi:basic membrane lipoprotein Med (substrate-binding protein (PBP1-ABC) superfamily)
MSTFSRVTGWIGLAAIALAACAPRPLPAAPAAQAPAATAAPSRLKVFAAYATPLEEPWPSIIHAALSAEQDAGNIEYRYQENIGYQGDMDQVIRKEIEDNQPDIIMGDAFGNEDIVSKAAADNPTVAFAFGMPGGPANPNLSVFDNWIHEPAYLSGLIAGKLTKSNKIGVVAAMPIPEVNRIVNGFIQGARETNPDAEVSVSYINSFFDPAQAKEAALAHVAAGADVLFAERFGVIEAAKENGIPAFGAMKDQNELAPDTVVTGPVWDMSPTVRYVIDQVKKGAYQAQDLKDFSMMVKGGASLAPYHSWEDKLPAEVKDLVKTRMAEIISGKFRVDINESDPARK